MIKSFRHGGLGRFYRTGSKAGIKPKHAKRLTAQLTLLEVAIRPSDLGAPNWHLHELKGDQASRWSIWVDEKWRLTEDYH